MLEKRKIHLNIGNSLFFIMEFFCFFPFLFPLNFLPTDTQPYALILGIMICLIKWLRDRKLYCHKEVYVFAFLFAIAIIIGLLSVFNTSLVGIFRAWATYFSIFFITKVLEYYDVHNGKRELLYKIYILIWFLVGLIQFFIDRQFMTDIISGSRISLSGYRGCISLASEPSFLGVQCYYFLYITKFFTKNKTLFYVLNIILGVIFAQSFVGILFITTFFIQEYFDIVKEYKKAFYLILGIIGILLLGKFMLGVFPDSRIVSLINGILNEGIPVLFDDQSGQVRMDSIIAALESVIGHCFLPQGFGIQRVGCAWGSILIEIGFWGIIYMVIIIKIFTKAYHKTLAKFITIIFIFLLYFSNVQLSNPMFAFVLGYILTFNYRTEEKK